MLNFLLASLVFVLSSATFTFSYCYSGIARVFTGLGKGIAETSVVQEDEDGVYLSTPYFDRKQFESKTEDYFESNLKRYLSPKATYRLSYSYFDAFSSTPSDFVLLPSGVTLSFSCPVSWFGTYQNSVTFTIREGNIHE